MLTIWRYFLVLTLPILMLPYLFPYGIDLSGLTIVVEIFVVSCLDVV